MTIKRSMTPDDALAKASKDGWCEVASGVYLNSRENIIDEQKKWGEGDKSARMDFTAAPFWMTTNDGIEPVAVHNAEDGDLREALGLAREHKINLSSHQNNAPPAPGSDPPRTRENSGRDRGPSY